MCRIYFNPLGTHVWGLVLTAFLLAGCASNSERGTLNFGVLPAAGSIVWPPVESGEVARYSYAGELTGEANFREVQRSVDTEKNGFWRWLAGLLDFDEPPVVLQRPQSGVLDAAGSVYVTDMSRQAVLAFNRPEGRLEVWDRAEPEVRFVAPTGIALGLNESIYVADAELGIVAQLNQKGESIAVLGRGELRRPVGVAFDASSLRLYVVDTYAHNIKVFDVAGKLLNTFGQRGEAKGEFNYPTYIAVAQNKLYVTDTMNARVQVLDATTGQVQQVIGQQGLSVGNLVRPKGVAVDAEGNVYVVESYYDHLLVFNKDGDFLMPITGASQRASKFYLPAGVWVDAQNRIFVADMFNGRVVIFQYLSEGVVNEQIKKTSAF
jgi:DNA-binding beta-propeller fold protein YncE